MNFYIHKAKKKKKNVLNDCISKYTGENIKEAGYSRAEQSLPRLQTLQDDVLNFRLLETSGPQS